MRALISATAFLALAACASYEPLRLLDPLVLPRQVLRVQIDSSQMPSQLPLVLLAMPAMYRLLHRHAAPAKGRHERHHDDNQTGRRPGSATSHRPRPRRSVP